MSTISKQWYYITNIKKTNTNEQLYKYLLGIVFLVANIWVCNNKCKYLYYNFYLSDWTVVFIPVVNHECKHLYYNVHPGVIKCDI